MSLPEARERKGLNKLLLCNSDLGTISMRKLLSLLPGRYLPNPLFKLAKIVKYNSFFK